jgi:uncharacterized membrane protein
MMRGVLLLLAAAAIAGCGQAPAPPASEPEPQAGTPAARQDPWDEARSRGIELRAVGNEPGWYLEVDEQAMMKLVYAYGERQANMPSPTARVADGVTTYDGVSDGHVMRVVIRTETCSDGMSDLSYPLAVSVAIDDVALRGCGRWLNGRQ